MKKAFLAVVMTIMVASCGCALKKSGGDVASMTKQESQESVAGMSEQQFVDRVSSMIADRVYDMIISDPEMVGELIILRALKPSERVKAAHDLSSKICGLFLDERYSEALGKLLSDNEGVLKGVSQEEFIARTKPRVISTTSAILSKKLDKLVSSEEL